MNRRRFREIGLATWRLALAVALACRIQIRFVHVRSALRARFGRVWLREQLPAFTLRAGFTAGRAILRTAVQPSSLRRLQQASGRLERILESLKALQPRHYRVTTRAGQRVYTAAAGKCMAAISGVPAGLSGPALLASLDQGLVRSLITWLENSGVGRERVLVGLAPGTSVTGLGELLAPARAACESERIASADRLARQELHTCAVEQELRHLAIPRAILQAAEQHRGQARFN